MRGDDPRSVARSDPDFGRNKVQYQTFTFQVLHTKHFEIYYYDEERATAALVARMAQR